jgi:hypothetical protein
MIGWLQSLENSGWATWLKESPSIWGYPTLLFLHTVGLSFTAGPSVAIDLRLLGVARRIPLAALAAFFTVIWTAFVVSVLSGIVLLASDATAKLANPAYLVKMALVLIAIVLTVVIRRRAFAPSAGAVPDESTRWLALASIACWFGAIAAGRYIAYF